MTALIILVYHSAMLRYLPLLLSFATTCYGMNDHRYQPSSHEIRQKYRQSSEAILRAFKTHGVRVIQGAPGTVGKMPHWVKEAKGTVTDLNLGLLELRNIDVTLAQQEAAGFADVFLSMLVGGFEAQQQYGSEFMISGKDGVHPGWAGQLVMAHAFLKALGLNGEIGIITLDLEAGVNLADDFVVNPFSQQFQRVDEAVARKQAYETRQIKDLFHGPEGRVDMEGTALLTEKVRQGLTAAIEREVVPVRHTLDLEALNDGETAANSVAAGVSRR